MLPAGLHVTGSKTAKQGEEDEEPQEGSSGMLLQYDSSAWHVPHVAYPTDAGSIALCGTLSCHDGSCSESVCREHGTVNRF